MSKKTILASRRKLDDLFDYIKELRKLNNFELEAQWATYLCIRVSGFLETSIRAIYIEYCSNKSHPNISKYVAANLESNRSQNMRPENILSLALSFNEDWKRKLETYILEDGRKEAIESVINIRNSAAHGGTMSVSYVNVNNYYKKILDVIEFITELCEK
jgi:hypothetical protein